MIKTIVVAAALAITAVALSAQEPTKGTLAGVTNFARVETTIACAGAIDAAVAVPEIKKLGFVSVINFREATENGANVDQERQIVEAAGLKYIHIPMNSSKPDPKVADTFLAAMAVPGSQPAFIHCASGNRAAAIWMIKRIVLDKWDADQAGKEAAALGLTNPALRQFALDYAQQKATTR